MDLFYMSTVYYEKHRKWLTTQRNDATVQSKMYTKLHGDNTVSEPVAMATRTMFCCCQWIQY